MLAFPKPPSSFSGSLCTGAVLIRLTATLIGATPLCSLGAEVQSNAARLQAPTALRITVPVITTQPASAVVIAGRPVTFSVAVTSAGIATYQWMRNGSRIPGATAGSLVIPASAVGDSGASYSVSVKNSAGTVTSSVARLTVNAISAQVATSGRPFSDQSPWNSRPSKFTLGSFVVPQSDYFPNVEEGAWSVGVFVASVTDPAVSVYGASDAGGIWLPDNEATMPSIVIPHWPAGVVPSSGTDAHADIVDVANNRVHSFWQLRLDNGTWRTSAYTWTALDGRGFGTPAQYMQGARAAGVPSMAGLIRKSEVDDGLPAYQHALVISLTFNALAANPAFAFPATSSDYDAATTNHGSIPEGARMMIPASFDATSIKNPRLLKIVRTLQSYGAFVADRNSGTPYVIYVENGSNFNLMPNGWDNAIAAELELIRGALRQVVATTEWVDANGVVFTPDTRLNLLSMRGPWLVREGTDAGTFDTQKQAVVFANNGVATRQTNGSGRSMPSQRTTAMAGKAFVLKVTATGGAQLVFELTSGGKPVLGTGPLADGSSTTFTWPADGLDVNLATLSGPQGGGTVSATLTAAN